VFDKTSAKSIINSQKEKKEKKKKTLSIPFSQ
jgi:hypothetical protein